MDILLNIDVPDLQRAIRFYEQGMGLRLNRTLFSETVAEMAGGGVRVFLLEKAEGSPAAPGAAPARTYRRHWTPVHLDFVVEHIGSAVDRAVKAVPSWRAALNRFPGAASPG